MGWIDDNILTILNGFALAGLLFLIAVGLSLVFGTMDVLNLAHGSIALAGAYVGVAFLDVGGGLLPFAAAAAVALGIGAAVGLVLTFLTRRLQDHLQQALLTLGLALVAADILKQFFGADVESVPAPQALGGSVSVLGSAYPEYRLYIIGISLLIGIGLYLGLERTQLGAIVRATVADRRMVEALGIPTTLVLAAVFGIGAALASLGGLLAGPVLGAQPGLDSTVLLLALVVVVVGGLGSIRGAVLGAVLVGQVQTLGVTLLPEQASFLLFAAMALVLLVRPSGLLPATTSLQATR